MMNDEPRSVESATPSSLPTGNPIRPLSETAVARLRMSFVGVLALHLAAFLVMPLMHFERRLDLVILIPILGSQSTLLVYWLFWGRTPLPLRVLGVAYYLVVATLWLSQSGQRVSDFIWPHVVINMLYTVVGLGMLRLVGFRLLNIYAPGERSPQQYSLRHLFIAITLAAPLLALARWALQIAPANGFNFSLAFLIVIPHAVAMTFLAPMAFLATYRHGHLFVLGTVLLHLIVVVAVMFRSAAPIVLFLLFITASLIGLSLLPIRNLGFRLTRRQVAEDELD